MRMCEVTTHLQRAYYHKGADTLWGTMTSLWAQSQRE